MTDKIYNNYTDIPHKGNHNKDKIVDNSVILFFYISAQNTVVPLLENYDWDHFPKYTDLPHEADDDSGFFSSKIY